MSCWKRSASVAGAVLIALGLSLTPHLAIGNDSMAEIDDILAISIDQTTLPAKPNMIDELPGAQALLAVATDPSPAKLVPAEKPDAKTEAAQAAEEKAKAETPSAVPEPSAFALFAFGLLFLYYLVRQRRGAFRI